ncbi:hypothetical protein E2C01_096449 [Portunus trituberculatus]|uniref:Uncharacterized protein n=1 Tax=Portunus trituberculatus TaxID=210409 RepID=A0A5B7JXZ8_PORTR|nr:hypothetical protein [Portunus trituberculatus]
MVVSSGSLPPTIIQIDTPTSIPENSLLETIVATLLRGEERFTADRVCVLSSWVMGTAVQRWVSTRAAADLFYVPVIALGRFI